MATDDIIKRVSKALGLGDDGLVQHKDGVALTHRFADENAAKKAVSALEDLRWFSNVAAPYKQPDGTYQVIIHGNSFDTIKTFRTSEVKPAENDLKQAIAQDKATRAAWDKKFKALQDKIDPKDLSFEDKKDADALISWINNQATKFVTPYSAGNTYNSITASKQSDDGRWVVDFNPIELGRSGRTVDSVVKTIQNHNKAVNAKIDAQAGNMQRLSEILGVEVQRDGDVHFIKTDGIKPEKAGTIAAALNKFNNGLAIQKDGRIIIHEQALPQPDNLGGVISEPALDKVGLLTAARDAVSAAYVDVLNTATGSKDTSWAVKHKNNDDAENRVYFDKSKAFATEEAAKKEGTRLGKQLKLETPKVQKIDDKYYAVLSPEAVQSIAERKAKVDKLAAKVKNLVAPEPSGPPLPPKAAAAAPTAAAARPAAASTAAAAPTTTGAAAAAAPATPPPPAEESEVSKNMFTLIGAAIPALLLLSGGFDVITGLLLMLGGLLIGGMLDKEKGGFVGQMMGRVMGKDGPTLDGLDTSKDKSLSKDELAAGLNKNADKKLDTKELSALSADEQKKLFDALQANANKVAVKTENGKMVEVDLDKITAPINLPATPAAGTGPAAGK